MPAGKAATGLEKYATMARAGGAEEASIIPARNVVTAEWVRLKCQFGCSGWGKRLCCPPFTPTPETTRRMLKEFHLALIYTYRRNDDRRGRRRMAKLLAAIERQAFLDGHYRALGMGAGPCRFCAACDPAAACRFPELARPAMEACGIDVYATCRNSGIALEVATDRRRGGRYVSLVLIT